MAMATQVHIFVCIEGSEAAKVPKVIMLLGCYSLVKVSVACAYTLLVWRIHSDHSLKFHFLQIFACNLQDSFVCFVVIIEGMAGYLSAFL